MNDPDFLTWLFRRADNLFQMIPSISDLRLFDDKENQPDQAGAAAGEQPAGPSGTGSTDTAKPPEKEEDWQAILKRWAKNMPQSSIPQLPAPPPFPGQPYNQTNPYAQVYMQYGPYNPYGRY